MNTTRIASLLILMPALLSVSCGSGDETPPTPREFVLAEIPAEDLRNVGMAIEMTGDTVGMSANEGMPVLSPDSSKVAYSDGMQLVVRDADGKTSRVIYETTDDGVVKPCFNLRWGDSGHELSYTQARESSPGTLQLMTVTITLGSDSEEE